MTTVLLTGFEPFDGQQVNASWEAVRRVASRWPGPEVLVTVELPVSFRRARQDLRTAVAAHTPDLVVCVGEAGGRSAVGLERVAINVIDARIPDEDGSAPVDVPVIAGQPAAYFSTLPIKSCLAAARAAGVPTEVSGSAGTFVCNATAYALGHLLERLPGVRGGFVHVPRAPGQVTEGGASLEVESSARALEAVLRAALDTTVDVRTSAGTLA